VTEEQNAAVTSQDAPATARPFVLGRKVGMLQHFREDGTVVGATIISAEPNVITLVRTRERDGYTAIQIGYDARDEKRLTKPALGHLKGLSPLAELREIRLDDVSGFERGQRMNVGRFAPGDKVDITGVSKGKGFQGPTHLHHFKTGPKTHGSDHYKRQGSVGAGTTPGRVLRGMRMARKMGVDRVTVKNLEVLRSDAERGVLIIKGAIPGARNGIVFVRKS
jgi:large subunit ribosomal protein L3